MPIISVIVPVYNVEKYLDRCVKSILNQTFTDFELILIDDGSPDNCPAMCDAYAKQDDRIVVIHQQNGGLSAARNTGIDWVYANSDSEWITFIDSDDWVHTEYLARLVDAATQFPVPVVKCPLIGVRSLDEIPSEAIAAPRLLLMEEEYLSGKSSVCAVTRLYKKEAFEKIRFPVGKLHEDLFVMHELMFQYDSIAVIDTPLYYYWYNEEGITKGKWNPRRLDEFEAYRKQLAYFKKKSLPTVYDRVLSMNILAVEWQYDLLLKTELAPQTKSKYLKRLQHEMAVALMKKGAVAKRVWQQNKRQFEIAFPKFMWLYWSIKGVISKFIKK